MKFVDVRAFSKEFYRRFSTLNLQHLQLRFFDGYDSVSIVLCRQNETRDIEAAVDISKDSVFILKINTFENIDVFSPLIRHWSYTLIF